MWSLVEDVTKLYMTCAARNDFYFAQCVKAVWALTKLVPFLASLAAKQEALLAFVRCLIAVYVARGRPGLPAMPAAAEEEKAPEPAAAPVGKRCSDIVMCRISVNVY